MKRKLNKLKNKKLMKNKSFKMNLLQGQEMQAFKIP